jgi:putative ABC transport system permease protein
MKQAGFYLLYAARNLWRNRRWSSFAIFSIAAGVAAVVALRSLGLAIGDALTDNVRGSNKGDITITIPASFGAASDPQRSQYVFNEDQLEEVGRWAQERNAALTAYTFNSGSQITALNAQTAGRPQFINTFFIDPSTYPVTQDIYAVDPPGVPLGALFQGGNEVVISKNLADSQEIRVGDYVRVSGTEEEFVVRGIVPTDAQAGLRQFLSQEIFSVLFGFAFFDRQLAGSVIPVASEPNRLNINLPDGSSTEEIETAASELYRILVHNGSVQFDTDTVVELLRENQFIADILGRLIVSMGLGAMLIGGVGIINTMLVMVRRRTEEIAALKTFGLKGRQIALLFMAEAFWLGLFGSLLGSVFGILLSGVTNTYGATFIQQPLRWRFYPEAVIFGLALGLIVSIIFGVLPVITAARVRPAIILRPNETHIPAAGIVQSLIALLFVVISLGVIAGQIIGETLFGVIGVAVSLAILGLLVLLLWVVVWLVGKLPAFGWVDFKLALRNLSTRRLRTATTLLALSAGMFALSSIAFFGAGVRDILNFTLTETLGGNVLVFPVLPPNIANPIIDRQLENLEGVEYTTRLTNYNGIVESIDGQQVREQMSPQEEAALRREIREASRNRDFQRVAELSQQLPDNQDINIVIRDTDNPNPSVDGLIAGRLLTPEDRGKQVAVVRLTEEFQALNMTIGSKVTVDIRGFRSDGGQSLTFEVVGILEPLDSGNLQAMSLSGDFQVPPESIQSSGDPFQITLVQVQPEHVNNVLLRLTSIPLVYALDITFFDTILTRLIQQFSALPILVGLLSLGAAAVIMANTVALATLERRRQIGILKAIGLKGSRVLGVMLLENIFVCLLGGLLGIGLSALGVFIMTKLGLQEALLVPPDALPVAVALIAAAVAIGAIATFLSASVAVRERVLNVLRYE